MASRIPRIVALAAPPVLAAPFALAFVLAVAFLLALPPGPARATTGSEPHWSVGLAYRALDLDATGGGAKVRQLATPLSIYLSPREHLDLVFATGASRSTAESTSPSGTGDLSLSGLADTKIKGIARFAENRVLLSAGVGLPTGKREYDAGEAEVARALSQNLFGFRYKNLGQGLDVDLGAALAAPIGETGSAALGAGWLRKGGFRLLEEDSEDYKPGDEFTVTGGVDATSARLFFRGDATYHLYGADERGDREVFEEGNRLELEQLVTATWPRTVLSIRARESFAGENRQAGPDEAGPLGKTEGPASHWGEVRLSRSLREGLSADASASYSRYGASELELGDGYLAGFGAGVHVAVTEPLAVRAGGQILTGKGRVGDEGPKSDVSGFEVAIGLVYRPAGGE